nr:hypothetical protein [Tanacetum cinerariifolium]
DSYHSPHPTYETYSYDSYGNDTQFSYNCQFQFPLHYESEPGRNENYNSYLYDSSSVPQQYPCCARCGGPHETCQCDQLIFDEPYCKHCGGPHMNYQCLPMNQDSYTSNSLDFDQPQPPQSPVIHQPPQELSIPEMEDLKQQYLDELQRLSNLEYRDEIKIAELKENFNGMSIEIRKKDKLLQEEHESEGIPEHVCDVPSHDNSPPLDVSKDQVEDFSESNNEFSSLDDDSFSTDDIDYVEASPPDPELVSSEVIEIVIPETKSSSTSLNSLLEETNTFDNSLPEFETFCFDVKEISSGSTTTHPDLSLPEYEAFYDDHVKEISSGSPITHSAISLSEYDSFMFDLSINPFPPADRSDSYELNDELISFISAPKYDCFRFTDEPNSKDFTKDVVETISPMKEPQVLTVLPTHPTLQLNMKFQHSSESLFAYVVWIFLPFLVYSVVPPYLLSLRTEDIIFDPGICKYHFSKPDIPHRSGIVKKFNTHRSHLNICPMLINGHNTPPLDVLLFHFYPPLFAQVWGEIWSSSFDLKQALRGIVQYSRIYEDSRQWISLSQIFIISSV